MRGTPRIPVALLLLTAAMLAASTACAGPCHPASGAVLGSSVDHYLFDPILKRSWAVVLDCRHPERPASLLPVAGTAQDPAAGAEIGGNAGGRPWLRAGSRVRVWRAERDGGLRIQLSGIVIESAPLGVAVRVRAGERGVILHGIVRGADSVELVDSGTGWSQE